MTMLKTAWKYIKRNLFTLAMMEVLFQFFQSYALKPLFEWLFGGAMRIARIYYLTPATMHRMMTNPLTLAALVLDAFIMLSFILYRMFCLIECMRASRFNRSIPLLHALARGFRQLTRVYQPGNFRLLPIALLFMPSTVIPLLSTRVQGIYLPEFLTYYMDGYPYVFFGLFLVGLLAFMRYRRWIYTLHFFCYSDLKALPCTRNSASLYKARTTHVLTTMLAALVGFQLVYTLVTFTLMSGFVRIATLISARSWISIAVMSIISIVTQLIMKAMDCSFSPLMVAMLSAAFFMVVSPDTLEDPPRVGLSAKDLQANQLVACSLLIIGVITCVGIVSDMRSGDLFSIRLSNYPSIVAHRGDSLNATENTLEAFQSAIDNAADMIELDVQQAYDGVPFIFHDATLSRLGGLTLRVNRLSYEILKNFPIGKNRYSEDEDFSTIPTFEQALQLCQDQIALNVEIKANATDTDLVEQVVALMERYGFTENSMITSSSYHVLEKVKQLNPDIPTGYIMSVAMGSFESLPAADLFSIERSFVTRSMVNRIHSVDKTIAVWTVNDADGIREMAEFGADYIITDDIVLARDVIFSQEFEEPWMRTFYNWLASLTRS